MNEHNFFSKKNLQKEFKIIETIHNDYPKEMLNNQQLKTSDLILEAHKHLPSPIFSQEYFDKNYYDLNGLNNSSNNNNK